MQDVMTEFRGRVWEWEVSVAGVDETTQEEAAYDLTDLTLVCTIKRSLDDEDADALLSEEVTTHVDAAAGLSRVTFEAAETEAVAVGTYHADLVLYPGPHTIWQGQVDVRQPVTRRTS